MIVRWFVLLIAMILVAAPADTAPGEPCVDATVELAACDDELIGYTVDLAARYRATSLATPNRRDAIPSMPALARIFRPPRPSLA